MEFMQTSPNPSVRSKLWMRSMPAVAFMLLLAVPAIAQDGSLVLARNGRVIALVPYAPGIVRITLSTDPSAASAGPGYGVVAQPSPAGWWHERGTDGGDVFRSAAMVVRVAPEDPAKDRLPQPMPLDALNRQLRDQYFGGLFDHDGPHEDAVRVFAPHERWTAAFERVTARISCWGGGGATWGNTCRCGFEMGGRCDAGC